MTAKTKTVTSFYTEIAKGSDGHPIVVGWDFCKCGVHVSICPCPNGPTEPAYITKLREVPVGAAPTVVRSAAQAAPAKTAAAPVPSGKKGPKLPTCTGCSKPVTDDDADKNDDGTWTCFTCQEAGG